MLSTIRHYLAARRFDREPRGEQAAVERLLSQQPPVMSRPSPELRTRIMERLHESRRVERGPSLLRLGWVGLAAACVVVAAVSWFTRPPASARPLESGPGIVAILPQTAVPVIRMVANTMDRPILNEAQKVMDDTKRATNAVVRCVPFARRGG